MLRCTYIAWLVQLQFEPHTEEGLSQLLKPLKHKALNVQMYSQKVPVIFCLFLPKSELFDVF